MKKYLTIVLSLALVLPFVSCKFSSDYMLDGELSTANVWAAADLSEIEEQANALNQTATAQGAPAAYEQEAAVAYEASKILDMSVSRVADKKMQISLILTTDTFNGFDVYAYVDGKSGSATCLKIARTSDEVKIEQKDGKCFVTIKPVHAIRDGRVSVIIVDDNGAGDCKDATLQSN